MAEYFTTGEKDWCQRAHDSTRVWQLFLDLDGKWMYGTNGYSAGTAVLPLNWQPICAGDSGWLCI